VTKSGGGAQKPENLGLSEGLDLSSLIEPYVCAPINVNGVEKQAKYSCTTFLKKF